MFPNIKKNKSFIKFFRVFILMKYSTDSIWYLKEICRNEIFKAFFHFSSKFIKPEEKLQCRYLNSEKCFKKSKRTNLLKGLFIFYLMKYTTNRV